MVADAIAWRHELAMVCLDLDHRFAEQRRPKPNYDTRPHVSQLIQTSISFLLFMLTCLTSTRTR